MEYAERLLQDLEESKNNKTSITLHVTNGRAETGKVLEIESGLPDRNRPKFIIMTGTNKSANGSGYGQNKKVIDGDEILYHEIPR